MIFRNIKIAVRKLRANVPFFLINFVGLALALSILAVVSTYVYHELSFDNHIPDREDLYLISSHFGDGKVSYRTPEGLPQALSAEISGVEAATSVWSFGSYGFYEDEGEVFNIPTANVTPDFFQVFPADLLHGGKLDNLNSNEIVITASTAEKIFNRVDVVGKTLSQKDDYGYVESYLIKAVVKNASTHTSIVADAYLNGGEPRALSKGILIFNWIKKNKTTSIDQIEENLNSFYKKSGFQEDQSLKFTPLSKLHFNDDPELQTLFNSRSPKMMYTLICISALTILISGFNYINLTTAKYQAGLKEIGVRRTLGASNKQLVTQLASESAIHFLAALPIAYLLATLIFPTFTDLIAVDVPEAFLLNGKIVLVVVGITFIIGVLCGLYPSYAILHYKTPELLNQKTSKPDSFSLRKASIVTQYSISIILIVLSFGVHQQARLLSNRPLGFEPEQLLVLPDTHLREQYHAFKSAILDNPNVIAFTTASADLAQLPATGKDSIDNYDYIVGDFNFIQTMGIKLIEGEYFDPFSAFQRQYNIDYMMRERGKEDEFEQKAMQRPVIVSQDLVKNYGIENPIGKVIEHKNGEKYGTIIGVVEPFEFGSQRQKSPSKIILGDYNYFYSGFGYVRIANHHINSTIKHIEATWKKFVPNHEFSYSFADERIDNLYKAERGLTKVVIALTTASFVLSTLGLFSFIALAIQQRTKEIGIRKVMGATVAGIVGMVSKDFIKPLLMAILIAFPLAWYTMNRWLADFAYRIDIEWWMFGLAGLVAAVTALATVSFQAIRAAVVNPVESLRSE